MMIGMALFWGALILAIVWLSRSGVGGRHTGHEETALTILDRRFAEGALSLEDYHERRGVLTGATVPRPDQELSSDERDRAPAMKRPVSGAQRSRASRG